jgi:hypothetical protein
LACVRLGQSACGLLPTAHSGTFCQPWSPLRGALIRAGKTSYTAGTLDAMGRNTINRINSLCKLFCVKLRQITAVTVKIFYYRGLLQNILKHHCIKYLVWRLLKEASCPWLFVKTIFSEIAVSENIFILRSVSGVKEANFFA